MSTKLDVMKINAIKLIILLCIFFNLSPAIAQENTTAAQWQADLKHLQETIHNDYPFLFKKVTGEDFDTAVETFYAEIPNLEAHEIPVGFSKIISMFQYGHTQVLYSSVAADHVLPINLYEFTDGIFIEGAHTDYAATVGAKVIAIEGVTIKKALQMIRPVVPVENDAYFKAYGLRFVTSVAVLHAQRVIPKFKTDITLTLEKDGKQFEQVFTSVPLKEISNRYGFTAPNETWVSARDQSTTPYYIKHLKEKIYYFEYLKDKKVVYARQSQVMSEEKGEGLGDFYKRLFAFVEENDVEKLILDVRLNGGGNNFLLKPLITGVIETKKINQKGKLFVITGRRTFSACQNMVNRLDMYTNAIFVGEPTSENVNFYGDARPVTLPNSKLTMYLSWAWWQDKATWENAEAHNPEVAVSMSFEQYRTNQDPTLEAALSYKVDGGLVDPMEHLTKLFLDQNFEQFEKDATTMANDKRYAHFDFEGDLHRIAKMLTDQQSLQGAQYLYELNTRIYPESINSWVLLAKFMIHTKNIKAAKAHLKQAKALKPNTEQVKEISDLLKALKS